MQIYFTIIHFNFLRFLTYPFEIVALVVRRVIELSFLVLFWSVVSKSSTQEINLDYLVSYFLLAAAVADITMAGMLRLGQFIQNSIKNGDISNFLLRPIQTIPYMAATGIGQRGVTFLIAFVCLGIGLFITPIPNIFSLVYFLVALVLASVIAFSFNVLLGVISFYTVEARSVRFIFQHIIRVFAGVMVPLQFFPEPLRTWVKLSPFPSMVYTPVAALSSPGIGLGDLGISLVWALIFTVVTAYLWNRALKHYDAVGL